MSGICNIIPDAGHIRVDFALVVKVVVLQREALFCRKLFL